jgi:hypothetical protein
METTVKNIGLLFMGILLIVIWSFYHTFFKLFTTFHGNNIEQHLHEIAFLFWFVILIAQPILIRYKKFAVSKALKRFSYLLAPLVMFAIYYVAKEQYLQDVNQMDGNEAVARQTLALPTIFAFGVLCCLAMFNKENHFNYIRHIIAATLLLVGVGLSHAFVIYIHFPFSMGVSLSFIITDLILLTLMINDRIYGHTIKPYLVSLAIVLATHLVWFCLPNTIAWQDVAGKFVQLFF